MRTIDADKLVDMLYDNEFAVLCPLDEVSGVIDACPTVDAVPVVHGHWVHDGPSYDGGVDWYHCSACKARESGVYATLQYCAHCGARMDGEPDA